MILSLVVDMKTAFLTENFLLETKSGQALYHEYAENMPIFDYHCHLPPSDVAIDRQFENLTQVWLYGDHYKWRAIRTNGVEEKYCTGKAADEEKFMKWAETVPYTLRNPLYHWTHLELKRYFGVEKLLSPDTAKEIYDECSEKLKSPEYSARGLMRMMNVKAVCTTDDPADDLAHHKAIKEDGFEIKFLPAFRPDLAMAADDIGAYNAYLDKLGRAAGRNIETYDDLQEALRARHKFFDDMGCVTSDHGLGAPVAEEYRQKEVQDIFRQVRAGNGVEPGEVLKLKSALMVEFGRMDSERGWVMQLHMGAMRNNSTRMFNTIGKDTGFDSIGDYEIGRPLSRFLDALDMTGELPKTILYNLNPRDNELLATMLGNFQDGSCPGKMQFGSGWWFLDQKDGMERQINALSNLGLLSRFVGMLTDSRSFLSYPRHEYFRRILCNIIGRDIDAGLLPDDMELVGGMVQNICYNNAKEYFGLELS